MVQYVDPGAISIIVWSSDGADTLSARFWGRRDCSARYVVFPDPSLNTPHSIIVNLNESRATLFPSPHTSLVAIHVRRCCAVVTVRL